MEVIVIFALIKRQQKQITRLLGAVIFIIVLFLLIQASAREKEDNYSYRNVLIKMKAHFEKIKTYRCGTINLGRRRWKHINCVIDSVGKNRWANLLGKLHAFSAYVHV